MILQGNLWVDCARVGENNLQASTGADEDVRATADREAGATPIQFENLSEEYSI